MVGETKFFYKWSEAQVVLKKWLKEGWQCSTCINTDNMFVIRKDAKRC